MTKDELKELKKIPAEEFRKPMYITEFTRHKPVALTGTRVEDYPICPRCGAPTLKDYQSYCAYCGQHLRWCWSKMKLKK